MKCLNDDIFYILLTSVLHKVMCTHLQVNKYPPLLMNRNNSHSFTSFIERPKQGA